jgi:hypothetical protein
MRVLAQDAKNDEGLRQWWSDVDGYVRKVRVGSKTTWTLVDVARRFSSRRAT